MIEVVYSNSSEVYSLPESWDEVSADNLYRYLEILHTEENIDTAKIMILQAWMNIPSEVFTDVSPSTPRSKRSHVSEYLVTEMEEKLLPHMDIFFEDKSLEKWIIPTLRIPGKNIIYHGPSDMMQNVSAEEYTSAAHYHQMIFQGEEMDEHALRMFVASHYRPQRSDGIAAGHPRYNGDMREPFNENNLELIAENLSRLSQYKLLAVRFVWQMIMKRYAEMEEFSLVFSGDGKKQAYTDWDRIIRNIAGDKRGQVAEVRSMPMFEVFHEIQYLEEERREIEKRSKNNSSI